MKYELADLNMKRNQKNVCMYKEKHQKSWVNGDWNIDIEHLFFTTKMKMWSKVKGMECRKNKIKKNKKGKKANLVMLTSLS